jgi:hypothetical protein
MIHQDSVVQWMDLDTKEVHEKKIFDMFGQYISRSIQQDDGILEVSFNSSNTKIVDWKGWSDVKTLQRQANITEWIKLTTVHGKSIMATPDTLIMIYNPDKIRKGFHGESKYEYKIIPFKEIETGDIVRVRHVQNDDGYDVDFNVISDIELLTTSPSIGYRVFTKSGFFNGADFYLFGKMEY